MKRALFASTIAVLAAVLVDSVYSPLFVQFWSAHEAARMVVGYGGYPVAFLVVFLLSLIWTDAPTWVSPLVASAFLQWLFVGYLVGGVLFRDAPPAASPGGLRG